jgi:hypothetical protein
MGVDFFYQGENSTPCLRQRERERCIKEKKTITLLIPSNNTKRKKKKKKEKMSKYYNISRHITKVSLIILQGT